MLLLLGGACRCGRCLRILECLDVDRQLLVVAGLVEAHVLVDEAQLVRNRRNARAKVTTGATGPCLFFTQPLRTICAHGLQGCVLARSDDSHHLVGVGKRLDALLQLVFGLVRVALLVRTA